MKIFKKILSTAFIFTILAISALAQNLAQTDQETPKKPREERPEVPVRPKKDEPPRERPKEDDKKKPPKK